MSAPPFPTYLYFDFLIISMSFITNPILQRRCYQLYKLHLILDCQFIYTGESKVNDISFEKVLDEMNDIV